MKNGLYFTIILCLFSCETDFPINADYQEIPVVYGILDQSKKDQYVRVNKGFITDEDVVAAAAVHDNLYFDVDAIKVKLYQTEETIFSPGAVTTIPTITHLDIVYELKDSIKLNPIVIEKDIMSDNDFVFAYENNIVYTFNTDDFDITEYNNTNSKKTYILSVRKKQTNGTYHVIATAKTGIVADTEFMSPLSESLPADRFIAFINQDGTPVEKSFRWRYSNNAVLYQFKIIFYYQEVTSNDVVNKTISQIYTLDPSVIDNATIIPASDVYFTIKPEEFFYFLTSNIEENENVISRKFKNVDWEIAAAETELDIFLELNELNIGGINQNKPSYSNIIGGVGVFGSRYNRKYSAKSANYPEGIPLSTETKNRIKDSYPELKFE